MARVGPGRGRGCSGHSAWSLGLGILLVSWRSRQAAMSWLRPAVSASWNCSGAWEPGRSIESRDTLGKTLLLP